MPAEKKVDPLKLTIEEIEACSGERGLKNLLLLGAGIAAVPSFVAIFSIGCSFYEWDPRFSSEDGSFFVLHMRVCKARKRSRIIIQHINYNIRRAACKGLFLRKTTADRVFLLFSKTTHNRGFIIRQERTPKKRGTTHGETSLGFCCNARINRTIQK